MIEPILLTTARLSTFAADRLLTAATGFFFERDARLYLVTSRHVLFDEPSGHHPDRLEIEMHVNETHLTDTFVLSVLLYQDGRSVWKEGKDAGGPIDVAVLELDRRALPQALALRTFDPSHLLADLGEVQVGASLLVLGFPLGFHDTVHHLPVVRQAVVASSFGVRFQGQGYFLSDARTHRGTSGAPVVMKAADGKGPLPWKLLGIHSSSMDMKTRDRVLDDALGLNCVWYADILMTLTAAPAPMSTAPRPAALPASGPQAKSPARGPGCSAE